MSEPAAVPGTPAPAPYLVTPALRQRLDLVHHLLEFGRQIVLVTGADGSGKSRLLQQIEKEAAERWETLRLQGEVLGSTHSLLRRLATDLGVAITAEAPSAAELTAAVRAGLADIEADYRVFALLIDDADELPDEVCALLLKLAHNDDIFGELRIVLCADVDSELETRLQASAPSPALVHVVEVPRLTADQTGDLALQMCAAMPQSSLPPDPATIAKLVDDSDGLPAKIVRGLASAATLPQAAATPTRAVAPRDRRLAWLGAAVPALALVMWLAVRPGPPAQDNPAIEIQLPGAAATKPPEWAQSTMPPTAVDAGTTATAVPMRDAVVPMPAPQIHPPAHDVAAAPADIVAPSPPRPPATLLESATAAAPTTTAAARVPEAKEPPTTTTAVVAAPALEPALVTSDHKVPYTGEWLLLQAPDSYVIQLFGVRDRAGAERFVGQNDLQSVTAVIATTFEQDPWYIVVYGHYPDSDSARAAIEALPTDLKPLGPWARLVHSLPE